MKPTILTLFVLIALFAFAGCGDVDNGTGNDDNGSDPVALVSESVNGLDFKVVSDFPTITKIETKGGNFLRIEMAGFDHYGLVGEPALPALRKLVLLPNGADVKVIAKPLKTEIVEVEGLIVPNQEPVEKLPGAFARAQFAFNEDVYVEDRVVVGRLAQVVEEGMMRNHRLGLLEITPVEYNPARGELMVTTEFEIHLEFSGVDVSAIQTLAQRHGTPAFDAVVTNLVANKGSGWALFAEPEAGADYLIIYANAFHNSTPLDDFVSLKQSDGWTVHTANMASIGNTAAGIRNYIVTQYNTLPNLTFVLLVGDTDTITHVSGFASSSPATDLYYSCMTYDYIPDLLIGRFPVRTVNQLTNMVNKTETYETDTDDWMTVATFMASTDNFWISEGTHDMVIQNFLDPHNYTSHKLYTASNNATTAQVTAAFNAGTNYGIYSGHGAVTSWADGPAYSQNDVRNLTNTAYPFVCSFSCLTGQFQTDECFAETWVRDDHGASAVLASSVTSYWDEDDWFEKFMFFGMFDFPNSDYPDQVWLASANICGKAGVWIRSNHGGGSTHRYFEMYNLLGDPSMELYTY